MRGGTALRAEEISRPDDDAVDEAPHWRLAGLWFCAALLVRLVFLGHFSLWMDESFSLDDALLFGTRDMRSSELAFPVFFALERFALGLGGLVDVDHPDPARLQWWLRIVPALAGAAAVGAAFVSSRGFLRRRERHVLAALVAFSPWLLYFSQFARHYTLLLAFATPACFGMLRAWRDSNLRAGLRATVWLLLAVLTHPTALLLLGGHLAGTLAAALTRLRPLNRGLIAPFALPIALAVPAGIWWEPVLGVVSYKLGARDAARESPAGLLAGIGYNVGPVVVVLAAVGLVLLWRRERAFCVHIVAAIAAPTAFLLALALLNKSVDQRYLISLVPLAFCPAAVAVVALMRKVAARGAGAVLVPVAALLPYAPGFVSNYVDGDRHDLASAAAAIVARLQPGDGIIFDTHALARRYLPADFPPARLLEAPPPASDEDQRQYLRMWQECTRLWVVVPSTFDDQTEETASFQRWAWQEGRLQGELWPARLDYHQNRLRIFLVEPKSAQRWWPGWKAR